MGEITVGAYLWRGKTYKTIRGLHTAVLRVYPGCGLSFDKEAMVISTRASSASKTYRYFDRTFGADHVSIIADEPRSA